LLQHEFHTSSMSCSRTQPIYLTMDTFTTVCTPHVIEQALTRTLKPVVEFLDAASVNLTEIYQQCSPNTCHYIPVSGFFLYVRRKHNARRGRSELELISLTPNRRKHTRNRDYAQEVVGLVPKGESAFPSWFAEA